MTTLQTITVETIVAAPVEKAWKCFTGPEHITKWNQASADWHTTRAENDLRIGGKFLSRMEARDGSMGFDFEGVYDEVNPLRSFSYKMADGRRVHVQFTPVGTSTKVTETFDPETQNPVELQQQGWQAILDSYKQYTEAQKG